MIVPDSVRGPKAPNSVMTEMSVTISAFVILSFKDIRNTIQIVDLGTIAVLTNNKKVTNRNFLGKSGNY